MSSSLLFLKVRKPKPTEDDIDDECAEGVDLSALAASLDTSVLPEVSGVEVPAEGSDAGEILNHAVVPEAQVVADRLEGAEVVVLEEGAGVEIGAEGSLTSLILASQNIQKKKKDLAVSPHIKCPICNFCFKSKLALIVHKKRKHTEEERANPYKCKECGKRFRT